MRKVYSDATTALAGLLKDGMTIMAGGFGLCGIPEVLIEAVRESVRREIAEAIEFAKESPMPDVRDVADYVYTEVA